MAIIDLKNGPCSRKDVKCNHYFKDLAKMSEKKLVPIIVEITSSSHYLYHISLRKSPRHIRVDRFRPRDDTVPRCYSYRTVLYTPYRTFYCRIL